MSTCLTCGAIWSNGEYSDGCLECGGFALSRHCPICNGRCEARFHRISDMSNAFHEANYKGSCLLNAKSKPSKEDKSG
jgi:hypothetical protein